MRLPHQSDFLSCRDMCRA